MSKQTFIVSCWCGASTYKEALKLSRTDNNVKYNFYRLSCKKLSTALLYLKCWRRQAIYSGNNLNQDLTRDDAQYTIENTPDGINPEDIVAKGFTKDL